MLHMMKTIGAVFGIVFSALSYSMIYAYFSAGAQVRAIGIRTLFLQPLYWVLMIILISAEVWLAIVTLKQ